MGGQVDRWTEDRWTHRDRQTDPDGDGLPCASAGDHFPVVTAAVDEHVASHSVAPLTSEALRRVTLLRGRLVALDSQVVVGHLQLAMSRFGIQSKRLTVGLQLSGLAATAARLVDGLHREDILGATLQAVHGVVVLLDVGHDHPAVRRVTQTCGAEETGAVTGHVCRMADYLDIEHWKTESFLALYVA